jgi:hypothetical protein
MGQTFLGKDTKNAQKHSSLPSSQHQIKVPRRVLIYQLSFWNYDLKLSMLRTLRCFPVWICVGSLNRILVFPLFQESITWEITLGLSCLMQVGALSALFYVLAGLALALRSPTWEPIVLVIRAYFPERSTTHVQSQWTFPSEFLDCDKMIHHQRISTRERR